MNQHHPRCDVNYADGSRCNCGGPDEPPETNPIADAKRIEYLEESLRNCTEALQKAQQELASPRGGERRST